MRVVFATAEVSPIAKTGGLGDVCGSLPKALAGFGHDITIFMPYYRQARLWFEKNGASVYQVAPTIPVSWAGWSHDATFLRATLPGSDVPLILVANDHFFERDQIYARRDDGLDDFLMRYTFFCRAVIRGCELLDIAPDVLHCHDWHTALLPIYLDSGLRGSAQFAHARSVYTIHNLNYQGVAGSAAFALTGLHSRYWAPDALEHFGEVNPMKGGIVFGDQVTTVSPNYAREVQTPEHGAGLDGVLREYAAKFRGILNGIDTDEWDSSTDPLIPHRYDAATLEARRENKRSLAAEAGLEFDDETPIFAAVSRLVDQKGFQLLIPILHRVVEAGAQLLILGSGQPELEDAFRSFAASVPTRCSAMIGFDNALAHRIYGGADVVLMPSIYEPCGLNQMYALRYGALPLVRMTGGLADTVTPYDGSNREVANGFGFTTAASEELFDAIGDALYAFGNRELWRTLQTNGMRRDFSWDRSAHQYDEVYRRALHS